VSAKILDGAAMARQIRGEVAERVRALAERGVTAGLAAVLVGDDEPSKIYVSMKQKDCAEVGIHSERHELPQEAGQAELMALVERLNADPAVHGILVQLPLPRQIDVLAVHEALAVAKDVDGLTPASVGRLVRGEATFLPATPYGIVEMLIRSGIETQGAEVVIVGRGPLVGMPLSIMLAQKSPRGNATVTLCHTGTRDVSEHTRRADIVVVAAGRANTLTADMVKPGAVVVDVGINRTDDGLVGDVAYDEVAEVAGWITPVPGGVGPLTRAMLLVNTVTAAERAAG
jgi:methylenetetrahydrofolate dehydrogenase (NADP+)/methenyltetrahydrofolate cyclohydrolase